MLEKIKYINFPICKWGEIKVQYMQNYLDYAKLSNLCKCTSMRFACVIALADFLKKNSKSNDLSILYVFALEFAV